MYLKLLRVTVGLTRRAERSRVERIVYARHGRELMGWKSPVCKPCNVVRHGKNTSGKENTGKHGVKSALDPF